MFQKYSKQIIKTHKIWKFYVFYQKNKFVHLKQKTLFFIKKKKNMCFFKLNVFYRFFLMLFFIRAQYLRFVNSPSTYHQLSSIFHEIFVSCEFSGEINPWFGYRLDRSYGMLLNYSACGTPGPEKLSEGLNKWCSEISWNDFQCLCQG